MNKKLVKQQQSISMEKFLRDYCHLENADLINMLSSLSHKELKAVCSDLDKLQLMTLAFADVSIEEVQCGEVLFVNDVFYNPAPYRNPNSVAMVSVPSNSEEEEAEIYEDIIDTIEDNLTIENVKIKSIGSFKINKGGKS